MESIVKTTISILLLTASFACAQTLDILYTWAGNPFPIGSLVQDTAGNLYGVTRGQGGGDYGSFYELAPDGTFTVLHTFTNGTDGANPYAGLTMDGAGNVYGTTGGGYPCPPSCGSVFEYSTAGVFTILHTFLDGADGAGVTSPLVFSNGAIYGTTFRGGTKSGGTIFRITNGTFKTIHAFGLDAHGAYPEGSLAFDATGSLWGTTESNGTLGYGTIFKLKLLPTGSYSLNTIHNFTAKDGGGPSGISIDANGMPYGSGRNISAEGTCSGHWGYVYKLVANPKGGWTKKTIHNYCNNVEGGAPAWNPVSDSVGNLYGASEWRVFELAPQPDGSYAEQVLDNDCFSGICAGTLNWGSPLLDGAGNLYGTGHAGAGDFVYRISSARK